MPESEINPFCGDELDTLMDAKLLLSGDVTPSNVQLADAQNFIYKWTDRALREHEKKVHELHGIIQNLQDQLPKKDAKDFCKHICVYCNNDNVCIVYKNLPKGVLVSHCVHINIMNGLPLWVLGRIDELRNEARKSL